MNENSAAQTDVDAQNVASRRGPGRPKGTTTRDPNVKRLRGVSQGRLVASVPGCFGMYVMEQADELGVPAPTMVRMLLMEAFKARGLTRADLEARYESNSD